MGPVTRAGSRRTAGLRRAEPRSRSTRTAIRLARASALWKGLATSFGVGHQAGQLTQSRPHRARRRRDLRRAGRPLSVHDGSRAPNPRAALASAASRRRSPLAVALLVAAALGAVLVITTQLVSSPVAQPRQRRDRRRARGAFDSLLESRASAAMALTTLVTELPVFRAHLTDARLAERPRHHRRDGRRLPPSTDGGLRRSSPTPTAAGWRVRDGPGAGAAAAGRTGSVRLLAGRAARTPARRHGQGHELFLLVSVPARFADEVLGTLTVGLPPDRRPGRGTRQAGAVRGRSCCPATDGRGNQSSMPRRWPTRRRWSPRPPRRPLACCPICAASATIGTSAACSRCRAMPTPRGVGRLVLLADWQPTQQFVDRLRGRFLRRRPGGVRRRTRSAA